MKPYIGEQMRIIRKEKNMTMKQLALEIGLTEQAISQYERGVRKPNKEILDKICNTLNVNINDLYAWNINDLALIMDSIVKIFDKILEDEENVGWKDIVGFTNEEFSEITSYIYNWADSIIESRKEKSISEHKIRFTSEYIKKNIKKSNNS